MTTDDLIARLSGELRPAQPAWWAFRAPIAIGLLLSVVAMLSWLGPRPDLAAAILTRPFWMKFVYTAAFAVFAFWLTERLGRPGTRRAHPLELLGLVVLALFAMAAFDMMKAAPAARHHMMMGVSSNVCPWRIVTLALPFLAAALWSLRRLAPTNLALTGFAAGLFAGAAGALVYAFHCTESTAPFVAIWYTLGIAVTGLIGALAGRWLLRWQ